MCLIPEDKAQLVLDWNEKTLPLDEDFLLTLKKIGGRSSCFIPGAKALTFPCRVLTKNKKVFDPTFIFLSDWIPHDISRMKVRLVDEIVEIDESEYALSRKIRNLSRKSKELRKEFAPLAVIATDGTKFTLNWDHDIFKYESYKGKYIELDTDGFNFSDYGEVIYSNLYDFFYFLGDYPMNDSDLYLTEKDGK